jgi:hypothetical protein
MYVALGPGILPLLRSELIMTGVVAASMHRVDTVEKKHVPKARSQEGLHSGQREQKLGTIDVEDEKGACAVPSGRTLDYDMARAIQQTNKLAFFFLPFFSKKFICFRNITWKPNINVATTSETKHNVSNTTRHW